MTQSDTLPNVPLTTPLPTNPVPIMVSKWVSIIYRQFQIYFNQQMKEEDLTSSEYMFLLVLYCENNLSQDALSSRLYIDKAATARSLKALEEKGYLTRTQDITDKRIKRVNITEKGVSVKSKIMSVLDNWNAMVTEDLTPTEVHSLSINLEKLTTKIRQLNIEYKETTNE